MRLHIGGTEGRTGWTIVNAVPGPGVDYVGDCSELDAFDDGSVEEIYASHVLEHLSYVGQLPRALVGFRRVLRSGGRAMISVPDFEVICRLFVEPQRTPAERYHLMRIAFGGQTDEYDFHCVGLTFEFLSGLMAAAGFERIERLEEFGLFEDSSSQRFRGVLISLNLIAYR